MNTLMDRQGVQCPCRLIRSCFHLTPLFRTCPGGSSPEQCGCSGHNWLPGQAVEAGTSNVLVLSCNILQCYGDIELSSSGLFNPNSTTSYFNPSAPSDALLFAWIFIFFSSLASSSSGILLVYVVSKPFCVHYDILCMCQFPDPAPWLGLLTWLNTTYTF